MQTFAIGVPATDINCLVNKIWLGMWAENEEASKDQKKGNVRIFLVETHLISFFKKSKLLVMKTS